MDEPKTEPQRSSAIEFTIRIDPGSAPRAIANKAREARTATSSWFATRSRIFGILAAILVAAIAGGLVRGPGYGLAIAVLCLVGWGVVRLKEQFSPLIRDD